MAKKDKPIETRAAEEPGVEAHGSETQSRIEPLRREVDRLIELAQNLEWRLPWSGGGGVELRAHAPDWKLAPAMNFAETAEGYSVSAELPGIADKDIEVKVVGRVLMIRGEKSEEKTVDECDYHLSERRFGRFQRSFRLPEDVDADRIEAKMDRGVLTVGIPKSAQARESERRIDIRKG